MSIGLKADPSGNSGAIQIGGVDKVVVTNAGDVAATTFTGNLIGNADTATKFAGTTGTAPVFGVRAWVNFDGTKDSTGATSSANTNRFILGSGNITSVLRLSTGRYQVNFAVAMPNTSYSINYSTVASTPGTYFTRPYIYPLSATVSSCVVWNLTEVSTNSDPTENSVIIVG